MRTLIIAVLLMWLGGESAAFDMNALCRGQGGMGCCSLASYAGTEQCKGHVETRLLENLMYSGQSSFQACDYMKEHQNVRWPTGMPCLFCRGRVICTGDTYNNQSED